MNLWVPCLVRRPVPSSKQVAARWRGGLRITFTRGMKMRHSLLPRPLGRRGRKPNLLSQSQRKVRGRAIPSFLREGIQSTIMSSFKGLYKKSNEHSVELFQSRVLAIENVRLKVKDVPRWLVLFMIVVFDWARAFLSLLRGQVATCLSKGDFPAYLGICYRKKEEESNDFPNSVRKKNQFVRAGAEKQSTEWVPVVHK
ncbi:hypothetical protein Tco_1517546 [Tanacetum coccineum]